MSYLSCNIMNRDPKANSTVKMQRVATNELKPVHLNVRQVLEKSKAASILLKTLAVFGVSLIMADGVLTPAQSVLGAIQGLEVIAPDISSGTIIGVSCAILILLFLCQPLGITKLGSAFAPIVIIWMLLNFSFGAYNLAKHDAGVLKAFSPYFAGLYFVRNKAEGWKSLGGILLAFTGVEALFADLGAFSKRAIQISWLCFCYPCLLLAYIGQAAYISDVPSAYSNPFFNTLPSGAFWPSLIISILAAIVASQAIITSTFQLLVQVMSTSYFPQIKAIYTSSHFFGQVYIPMANWLLLIGCIVVTAVYSDTTRLGHAYGVCVILVTFITTCMVTLVALIVWRINSVLVLVIFIPFITLDGLFLSSALTKVPDGAWFTLLLAVILASIFILWRFGKDQQWTAEAKDRLPINSLVTKDTEGREVLHEAFGGREITKIKGLGIFFDKAGHSVPAVYAQFLQKFEARPDVHAFLQLRALGLPTVKEDEKYTVSAVRGIQDCYRVVIRHGYNDEIVTKELGGDVYKQVRKYIVGIRPRMETIRIGLEKPAVTGRDDRAHTEAAVPCRSETFKQALTPPKIEGKDYAQGEDPEKLPEADNLSTLVSSAQIDALIAAKLAALDQAFKTQVVYIVGKEQLRIPSPQHHTWMQYIGRPAWRRAVLGIFIWIRENTRAKVASMRIPVEKLVEVGFVKEI
ncbi:MAG: hypothetical protein Q9162_001382 [Coniocarpon cinnabarinum]